MDFLKFKNIRVQNNLVFRTAFAGDMVFSNHKRDTFKAKGPCEIQSLLNSPEWHFSHNWREIDPVRAADRVPDRWIPARPSDHLQVPINVLSRRPADPNFVRPPKDSPLTWSGAGGHTLPAAHVAAAMGQAATLSNPWLAGWAVAQAMHRPDPALPAYVGAVAPEGVAAWDWEKTWKMMTR